MADLVASLRTRWRSQVRPATRRWVLGTPHLWDVVARLRPMHTTRLVGSHTALVIEGFPRSGNSYSRAAFEIANGEEVHLAHHLHAPAHVLRATRLGIPTVVLIREPREAILSYLVYSETFRAEQALRDYISFYRIARTVADRVVVARFDRVVSDFGSVLEEVNEKFSTSFSIYRKNQANEMAARARVEGLSRLLTGGHLRDEMVARPSAVRTQAKEALQSELDLPAVASLLKRAWELYAEFLELEQGTSGSRPRGSAAGGNP